MRDVGGQFVLELVESGLAYTDGRFTRALDLVESALRTGIDAGDDTRLHLTRWWRCEVLAIVDRLDESLQLSTELVAAAQRDRQGWALHLYETARGRQLLQVGRLADAAAVLEERFTPETAHLVVSIPNAAGVGALGRIALHTGDRRLTRLTAEIAQVMLEQSTPSVRRHAAWLLALQAMADGDALRAHRTLCALGEEGPLAVLPLFPMGVADEVQLVHIALAAGDEQLAEAACSAAQRRSQLNPEVRSIAAAAAHATGLLHRGEKDLADAVALFDGGPRPLALAAALEDFAVASVQADETERGVDAFSRALRLFAGAGATWDAGRVRGRLRRLGVRRRLVSAPRPGRGWTALTDAELAVARLIAQGLTNREAAEHLFVSHHTISGHLRRVFEKLDINSRVELSRVVNLHDAID
jgi:DNA-binding CsgD family transcriptional regulator